MLIQQTLFGTANKIDDAINLLRFHEPPEGYFVAFSGGKDSVVVLDLVKRSQVKFEAFYNVVTIEPPELIPFIKKNYPEVNLIYPEKNFHDLIIDNGFPPMRQMRYCHRQLKRGGEDRIKITGVRAEESKRRAMKPQFEKSHNGKGYLLHLIHNWTTQEVWEYIHSRNIPYCSLYDEGKTRLGCLFCPFGNSKQMEDDARRYPQIKDWIIDALETVIKIKIEKNKPVQFKTGEEFFNWWIDHTKRKKKSDVNLPSLFES